MSRFCRLGLPLVAILLTAALPARETAAPQKATPSARPAPTRAAENITWLVEYNAANASLPIQQGWQQVGDLATGATLGEGALRINDDSSKGMIGFRAPWTPRPGFEIVVEATVRVEAMRNQRGSDGMYPWLEGVPVGLLVGDGRRQEGIALRPDKLNTFLDREVWLDAKSAFHTYRLVIHETTLAVAVDGKPAIRGEDAFWKSAGGEPAFVQFGSNSGASQGDSYWRSVRLGVRPVTLALRKPQLRVTMSEPWEIPSLPRDSPHLRPYGIIHANTRPFLHNLGQGLLLLSVAQGPDAKFEPYGVLRSVDAGKTWEPVRDLQFKSFTPQSFVRLRDGTIFGLSRWTAKYVREDGVFIGMSYRFDARAERFTMAENLIRVPAGMTWTDVSRDLFDLGNGEMLASVYCAAPGGRRSFLIRTVDGGATWSHYATIGDTAEPAVVRLSPTDMMAVLRHRGPMLQTWSRDNGKTWSPPVKLEERGVDPDLTLMSNGVVACSYGRPGSNLMFSLDQGRTWVHHRTVTELKGFNYGAVREVSPGRLLYIQDSPRMQALYVDVERLD